MKAFFILLFACLSICSIKADADNTKGFAVVELFTSEGCSSCPPADKLVARIQEESKGKPIYILSFHVDYWNRLGWKDVFSDAAYSKRQNQYAEWLHLETVYTPQAIVNGRKEMVGSQESTLRNTIETDLQQTATAQLHLSNARLNNGEINLQFQTEKVDSHVSLLLAVVQKKATTHVKSGENGGRTLSHVQVVRHLQTVVLNGKTSGTTHMQIPSALKQQDIEIIAFLQREDTGEIIAATNIELN